MSSNVKSLATQATPWNKQVAWWIVAVEGGVALLLGFFILFQPEQASTRFVQILGGYFFATSAIILYRLIAHKEEPPGAPGGYVRAGIGLVAGLVALLHPRMPTISTAAATTVLAIGFALSGAIGLYGFFATASEGPRRWGPLITNFVYLIFAFAVLVHNNRDVESQLNLDWWIGILSVAAGAALIFYGFRLRSAAQAAAAAMATVAATESASPTAPPPTGQPAPAVSPAAQSATATTPATSNDKGSAPTNGAN